jgi:lipoprotein-anchoring transpeptidase ErfK/SrfK/peptidoglycan hydrolase-like protein with peptidoglycan-binding domain
LFSHANLAGANLAKANLSGANLRFAIASVADLEAADMFHADLRLACFDHANLSASNLRGAVLDHASLCGANLAKANLSGASLRFAILEAATLEAADLSGADLSHARLDRADLSGANLSGALLDYADFFGANLANANLCGARLRYAKNLSPAQLGQGRVSDATILPFHPKEGARQPWTRGRSRIPNRLSTWIPGLLLGALACMGLLWQLLEREETALRASLIVPAAAPEAASRGAGAPPPEPLVATASARVAAATSKDVPLSAEVFAPDLRMEASEASPLVAAAPGVLAALHPAPLAPNRPAATSQGVSIVARRLPDATELLTRAPLREIVPAIEVSPPRLALSTLGPLVLSDAEPPIVQATPATLTLAVRELASEVQPGGAAKTATPPGLEPLTLVVSLREQKLDVYRGTGLVISSKVSSGKRGYDTKAGVFSILEKQRYHHSNLFSGAPMPWMQRLTWSGTALHAGIVPGYPASHGCVRLPFSFAPKLFQITTLGENVVVTSDRVAPKLIKHENLFQPAPRVAEAALAFSGQDELVTGIIPTAAAAENPEQGASQVEPALQSPAAAPLRILVTRRTERDEIIDTQYLLASLGYLKPQNFSGRLGDETQTAIKAFQKANGLRETGAFSDDLAKKVHKVAGKPQPPAGHLFVRQDFRSVLDAPIAFLDPERSLGTHVFTALGFAPGSGEARWMAISLEGGDPAKVLDRIQIPADLRQEISERLTAGSSLIVADTSVNSAILSEGEDFMVLAKVTPATAAVEPQETDPKPATTKKAKPKQAKAAPTTPALAKPRIATKPALNEPRKRATGRPIYRPDLYGGFGLFRRW